MSLSILAKNAACNPACRVCHYKNFDYPEQLRRKKSWAEDQLGRWKDVLQELVPAPENERLGYRSKSWLRSFFKDGEVSFGMYRAVNLQGRWEKEFISWDSCPLHVKAIQQMIGRMKEVFSKEAPRFVENSLEGVWVGSPHLAIVSRDSDFEEMKRIDWSRILVPPFNRVWFHCNPQVGRKIFGHHPIEPVVGSVVDPVHPIRAFRQVAQSLLVQARARAVAHLLASQPDLVLDLYCGTGDLSLSLPPAVNWIGIELSSEAIKYAQSLVPPGRAVHSAFVGTVEHRLSDPKVLAQLNGSISLYINPPRSGLSDDARERVLALLAEKTPTNIAYLSCSASSLARDLKVLEDVGYRVELLQPYDFFPQTEHFETLALLVRRRDHSQTLA